MVGKMPREFRTNPKRMERHFAHPTWLLISSTEVYANHMEQLFYLGFIMVVLLLPLPYFIFAHSVRLISVILLYNFFGNAFHRTVYESSVTFVSGYQLVGIP